MAPDTRIYDVAEALRDCVMERLEDTDAGAPDRSCVTTGSVSYDDCECGSLYVNLTRNFASQNFPQAVNVKARCGYPLLVWNLAVIVLRCAPTGSGSDGPTCEELDALTLTLIADADAVRKGIECCLADLNTRDAMGDRTIVNWQTGTQNFIGPEGMCAGSIFDATVGLLAGCCE